MNSSVFTTQEMHSARRMFLAVMFTLSTLATALLAPAATVREHGGQEADLIVHRGKVVTVDGDFSVRQAMAITDGLILRVGTDEEILRLKGPHTEVIDLRARWFCPA